MKASRASWVAATIAAGAMGSMGCGAAADQDGADERVDESADFVIGDHLRGIADTDFADVKGVFNTVETIDDGLGPIFNDAACGNCHNLGASGGAGDPIERRFGRFDNGAFDPLANEGGSLRQLKTLGTFTNKNGKSCNVPLEVGSPGTELEFAL